MSWYFFVFRVRAAKPSMWYHMIRKEGFVVFWGTQLRPTAGASCSVDPKMHQPAKRSLAMCEHTGVLRDFIVVFRRDICCEHGLIGRRNCLMTEAANSLSAAAGPELSTTRNTIASLALDYRPRQDSLGFGSAY